MAHESWVQTGPAKTVAQLSWDSESERRLLEMVREERSLEEIAREVSIPVDMLVERMRELSLDDGFERPW